MILGYSMRTCFISTEITERQVNKSAPSCPHWPSMTVRSTREGLKSSKLHAIVMLLNSILVLLGKREGLNAEKLAHPRPVSFKNKEHP